MTSFPKSGEAYIARVLPEEWAPDVRRAAEKLLLRWRQFYGNVGADQRHERHLTKWLRQGLECVPDGSRVFLVQDSSLRSLDLAALVPTAWRRPRLSLHLTPVFTDDSLVSKMLSTLMSRPEGAPARTKILVTGLRWESNDERSLRVALAVARNAGVVVSMTDQKQDVLQHIWGGSPRRVHVLVAHSPDGQRIAIGDRLTHVGELFEQSGFANAEPRLPAELHLCICHAGFISNFHIAEHATVIRTVGHIWISTVADIQCELWTSTLRRSLGFRTYWADHLTYGEALVQARALVRREQRRGHQLVNRFFGADS